MLLLEYMVALTIKEIAIVDQKKGRRRRISLPIKEIKRCNETINGT